MTSVEDELWNIFTYYSLHGDPTDPSRLDSARFYKLCRDSHITLKSKTNLIDELKLFCTAEVKKKGPGNTNGGDGKGLTYSEFITSLIKISQRCYPDSDDADDAFLHLLLDNILPFAHRRFPVSINYLINNKEIDALFSYYESSLFDIFKYYHITKGSKTMSKTNFLASYNKINKIKNDRVIRLNNSNTINNNNYSNISLNKILYITYSDFFHFAADFGLIGRLYLSNVDIGDIYLNSIGSVTPTSSSTVSSPSSTSISPSKHKIGYELPKMNFGQFWQAIILCAITIFRHHNNVAPVNKMKAMFQIMSKFISDNLLNNHLDMQIPRHSSVFHSGNNTKRKSINSFHERFNTAWALDDFVDYLYLDSKKVSHSENAVIRRLSFHPPTNIINSHSHPSSSYTIDDMNNDNSFRYNYISPNKSYTGVGYEIDEGYGIDNDDNDHTENEKDENENDGDIEEIDNHEKFLLRSTSPIKLQRSTSTILYPTNKTFASHKKNKFRSLDFSFTSSSSPGYSGNSNNIGRVGDSILNSGVKSSNKIDNGMNVKIVTDHKSLLLLTLHNLMQEQRPDLEGLVQDALYESGISRRLDCTVFAEELKIS